MNTTNSPTATQAAVAGHAVEASAFAKDTAADIQRNITEGDCSLRLLALLASIAMIVTSILGFVGDFLTLQWIAAVFKIYVFGLGLVVLILESGNRLSLFTGIESALYRAAPFLRQVWGRGFLYVIAGTILISLKNIVDLVLGAIVCFVGVMYIWIGRRTSQKLAATRQTAITSEQLQEKFAMADVDGKGSLTLVQFRQLTASLGLELNKQESEVAFLQMDYSNEGRLTYESVHMWWTEGAPEAGVC